MDNRSDNELYDLCKSNNLSLYALQEIINRLGPRVSSQNPLCFHQACNNNKVTLEIVQLLYNALPVALQLRDDNGELPIHHLCCNKDLDETNSLDILQFMLEIDPTLPRETNNRGSLPIHLAVMNISTAFCKILINAYPESLRMYTGGRLPIRLACAHGKRDDTADTIQYMLELDPELINEEDSDGYLPIHCADYGNTNAIELLLKFDPDAASKEANDGTRWLPLHFACRYSPNLSSIQVLYDAYPEAILARDRDGEAPLDNAREEVNQPTIEFLQTQFEYARQAQDMTAMTTVDENGQLPLHCALKNNAPLGSIKLLTEASPAAVQVSDQNGAYPLHIACEFSSATVVKFLVECDKDIVERFDANKDSPLHYACRGGNCGAVKYLVESHVPSVSERNSDNKLPIHLLLECRESVVDKESTEFIEVVWRLLLAYPEVVMA